ncbi:hypothetical protein ACFYZ4_00085 [Streptomyces sp. NPDC001513]|uniref:SbtR family transcriptional regulator n=1 Tax=Streptomyces sp. NPDC001513 TaxID=3364580 RepID=UPI00367CBA5E
MHSRVTATPDSPNALAALPDALSRTAELKGAVWSAGKTLLDRARAAGVVRADLAPADLVPLMCGIAYAVHVHGGSPEGRTDAAHRYLTALLEGLKTA